MRYRAAAVVCGVALLGGGCGAKTVATGRTASGYVEATDVHVAAKVAGRVLTVAVSEGQRVEAGQVLVTLATTDADLAVSRAQADRAQAVAQLRLLLPVPQRVQPRRAEQICPVQA